MNETVNTFVPGIAVGSEAEAVSGSASESVSGKLGGADESRPPRSAPGPQQQSLSHRLCTREC